MKKEKAVMLHISSEAVVAVEVISNTCESYKDVGHVSVTITEFGIIHNGDDAERNIRHYGYVSFKGKTPKQRLDKAFKYAFKTLNDNYYLNGNHIIKLNRLFSQVK